MFSVPPKITREMGEVTEGIENHDVTLSCEATGSQLQYMFYRLVVGHL